MNHKNLKDLLNKLKDVTQALENELSINSTLDVDYNEILKYYNEEEVLKWA